MPLSDEIDKETSHMDRITQLQDATDEIIRIMFNSVDYLTKKATFKQVNPDIPITQEIPDSEDPKVFEDKKLKLVEQLLFKAKQMEVLINALPSLSSAGQDRSSESEGIDDSSRTEKKDEAITHAEDNDKELQDLEGEMQEANEEYSEVLKVAEQLYQQLQSTIRATLDEHHKLSSSLMQQ